MDEQKIREAIDELSDLAGLILMIDKSAVVRLKTAIEALKKQLAMIPTEEGDYFLVYKCPKCEKVLAIGVPHCPYCGQKLDWSE